MSAFRDWSDWFRVVAESGIPCAAEGIPKQALGRSCIYLVYAGEASENALLTHLEGRSTNSQSALQALGNEAAR
jgi:hypothetical protein